MIDVAEWFSVLSIRRGDRSRWPEPGANRTRLEVMIRVPGESREGGKAAIGSEESAAEPYRMLGPTSDMALDNTHGDSAGNGTV